ncbi:hypothetical protein VCHA54P499_30342 [Vibrio chagasii]|nr:hypothetical protein VCHA54P499_30342 [Vibrio chagasii]
MAVNNIVLSLACYFRFYTFGDRVFENCHRDKDPCLVELGWSRIIHEYYSILYTFIYTMPLDESAMHAYLLMTYNIWFAGNCVQSRALSHIQFN